ncbi:MAG: T9SS type A sorting domain-containing protein [Bacteroidales bacterium]|nr:T9SS type A sorting domain-containing protein [Bacteroidales bacterium]
MAEARLYSVTGQLVATKQGNGTESLTVDVSGLPSGLYFVTAIGEDGSRSELKVVKE